MSPRVAWWIAKALQGAGLVVVLVGLFWSVSAGVEGQGLASMEHEFRGLFLGGALFVAGVLIERRAGRR
jgi:hypothetical protein